MSKYIDSLEWDRAENEVQRKARVIGDLNSRLTWLDNEIIENGGRTILTETEEIDLELFGEMPVEANLYLERLQRERLRTKDLLTIEQIKKDAEAIPDKTKRLFFLIEKYEGYVFDKEAYATGLLGWKGAFPDWIVPVQEQAKAEQDNTIDAETAENNHIGLSEDLVKQLLVGMQKEMPYMIKEMGEISAELVQGHYFPSKDMAGIIDELIKEAEQAVNPIDVSNPPVPVADILVKDSRITLAAIAILHVYLGKFGGQSITQQNKKSIALQYGYDAPHSGTRLFNEYTKYKQDSDRLVLPSTTNRKSANEHLKRFECILSILETSNHKAFQEATRDFEALKKMAEKYFL